MFHLGLSHLPKSLRLTETYLHFWQASVSSAWSDALMRPEPPGISGREHTRWRSVFFIVFFSPMFAIFKSTLVQEDGLWHGISFLLRFSVRSHKSFQILTRFSPVSGSSPSLHVMVFYSRRCASVLIPVQCGHCDGSGHWCGFTFIESEPFVHLTRILNKRLCLDLAADLLSFSVNFLLRCKTDGLYFANKWKASETRKEKKNTMVVIYCSFPL